MDIEKKLQEQVELLLACENNEKLYQLNLKINVLLKIRSLTGIGKEYRRLPRAEGQSHSPSNTITLGFRDGATINLGD